MRSLGARLAISLVLTMSVIISAIWLIVYEPVVEKLRIQDRAVMKDRLRTMRSLLQSEDSRPDELRARVEREWDSRDFDRTYVRIFRPDGSLLIQSPSLKELPLFNGVNLANISEAHLTRFEAEGMTLVGTHFSFSIYDGEKPYRVEIAFDRTSEADLIKGLREGLWVLTFLGLVGSVIGARLLVRHALSPVAKITRAASEIHAGSMKRRIDPHSLPSEFETLSKTFNEMLSRLEDSFERMSRFSSDMAHELRTPVHNLMGSFGVTLSQVRSAEDYAEALEFGVEECERLKRIIDTLLFIARARNPKEEIHLMPLCLSDEIEKIIEFFEASAEEAHQVITFECEPNLVVKSERTLFQRALGNILSNAIRYSDGSGMINISVVERDGRAFLSVKDQGCGIDENQIPHLGERFFRADPSRSQVSGGTGLGLSIVKAIAEMHGGTFSVTSKKSAGTCVQIDFEIVRTTQPES